MLLPATPFHFFTFTSSSSSSLFSFPFQFPNSKSLTPSKFIIRSSTSRPHILPEFAVQRIADKLHSLGIIDKPTTTAGDILVPLPHQLPKQRVAHTIDNSWSTPENPVPIPGTGLVRLTENELERQRIQKVKVRVQKRMKLPTLAELSLTDAEIYRLTELGYQLKKKMYVGKGRVTERLVQRIHEKWRRIHERWRRSEVVRVFCEDLCRINMKRTHDILERKTGGVVVKRSGTKIILYRGINYKYPYFLADKVLTDGNDGQSPSFKVAKPALIQGVGTPNQVSFQLPGEAELVEEADSLLEGLGPRFTDWWEYDPVQPVDADLLPAVIRGFRKPFRLLPYGVKAKLTDDEMTTLKRLGRPLPCHFALGRNRGLQGLAAAIIKLWERCEIAKIAVKRGVQHTSNKKMAKEIKYLTGGTLLSRNKEIIVIYRGKDFLPAAVSSAIKQQRNLLMKKVKAENRSSVSASPHSRRNDMTFQKDAAIIKKQMLMKAKTAIKRTRNDMTFQKDAAIIKNQMLMKAKAAIKRTSTRLSVALEKKAKTEELLATLEKAEGPHEQEIDKEGITKEERYMLRTIGLKMKPFLLLGRRGVFDGTVENMHLHWNHRELVKIMCFRQSLEEVHQRARTLEAESGGILVAVERRKKGYAIIVYRGKNYSRPASLRPQTLLNKKQALARKIEAQRYKSLKLYVLKLDKNINDLKLQMVKEEANNKQIADALTSDLPMDKHGDSTNSLNVSSSEEASLDNKQAIQEKQVELIVSSGGCQVEPELRTGLIRKKSQLDEVSDSVLDTGHHFSNNKALESVIQSPENDSEEPSMMNGSSNELPSRSLFLSNKENDSEEPSSNSINGSSSEEASLDNKEAIQEKQVELIVSSGERQFEPELRTGLIRKKSQLDEVSDSVLDTGHRFSNNKALESAIQTVENDSEEPSVVNGSSNEMPSRSLFLSNKENDSEEPSSNSINGSSSGEASLDNKQAIQEKQVELIVSSGARQVEPELQTGLIRKKSQLDELSDSVLDTGHPFSNNKALESGIQSAENDSEEPLVMNWSSNELPSRSLFLSNKERLLLRKQALKMKIPVDIAIGKSNSMTDLAKTIKDYFRKLPFVIVNVKGRAKGTSVHELVLKLEQLTGGVLVSQEPSRIILYRGWGAGIPPTKVPKERGAKQNPICFLDC